MDIVNFKDLQDKAFFCYTTGTGLFRRFPESQQPVLPSDEKEEGNREYVYSFDDGACDWFPKSIVVGVPNKKELAKLIEAFKRKALSQ
jgi:hypothetical protein